MNKAEILENTMFTGKLVFGNEMLDSFAEVKTLQFYFDNASYLVQCLENDLDDSSLKYLLKHINEVADEPEAFQDFIAEHPITVVCISGSQHFGFGTAAASKRVMLSQSLLDSWKENQIRSLFAEADSYSKQLEGTLDDFEKKLIYLKEIQRDLTRAATED